MKESIPVYLWSVDEQENPRASNLKVGDRVAFSKNFLQSIGAYTGDLPFARGIVQHVDDFKEYQIAYVKWDKPSVEVPDKVIGSNLVAYTKERGIIENPEPLENSIMPRIWIRKHTHRGKSGYLIYGTDRLGRKVSIFTVSKKSADVMKAKILSEETITAEDFKINPQSLRARGICPVCHRRLGPGDQVVHRDRCMTKLLKMHQDLQKKTTGRDFMRNPGATKIYNRCIEIRATKEGMPHQCDAACKAAGHRYKHSFKKRACIFGLPDGSLLIK